MAKKEIGNCVERLEVISKFVEDRKEIYLQEHRDSSTEVEKFIWSEMIGLLDEMSALLEQASL
jgi:hypothetical protein